MIVCGVDNLLIIAPGGGTAGNPTRDLSITTPPSLIIFQLVIAAVTNIFSVTLTVAVTLVVRRTEIEVGTSVTQVSSFNSLTESVFNSVLTELASQQLSLESIGMKQQQNPVHV